MADTAEPTEERLLVCVSPSSSSARLINAAKRMATDLHAEWFVAYVEQPKTAMLPEAARTQAADNLRLAGRPGRRGRHPARPQRCRGDRRRSRGNGTSRGSSLASRRIPSGAASFRGTPWINWCESAETSTSTSSQASRESNEKRPTSFDPRGSRCPTTAAACPVSRPGHPGLLCDVSLLPPQQSHHGLLAGGDAHRDRLRAWAGDPVVSPERAGLRFLLCPSSILVQRGRGPVHRHLRGDVSGGPRDQSPGCRDAPASHARTFAGAAGGGDARPQSAARQHQRGREDTGGGGPVHLGDSSMARSWRCCPTRNASCAWPRATCRR